MANLNKHSSHGPDWCHVCGNRTEHNTEIRYADNAEHERSPLPRYIRICRDCGEAIARIAGGEGYGIEERTVERLARKQPAPGPRG